MTRFLRAAIVLAAAVSGLASAQPLDVDLELGGIGFDMVHDAARGYLYVSIPALDEVAVIATDTFAIVDRLDVGSRPQGLDISIDGTRLFVALNGAGAVAVLNLDTLDLEALPVADVIGDDRLYDVIEALPDRVFVSASPDNNGISRLGVVRLDQGNRVDLVADGDVIRTRPVFEVAPDRAFLYVGLHGTVIYKLDLGQESAPRILSTSSGSATFTDYLAVSPAGSRIVVGGGQVLTTADFVGQAELERGVYRFGDDGDTLFVAQPPGSIRTLDATTYEEIDTIPLSCELHSVQRLTVLPAGGGWFVLGDDLVCAVLTDAGCESAPALPSQPSPADGATEQPQHLDLTWTDAASGCPTTYDVRFGSTRPADRLICDDTQEMRCHPGALDSRTTYQWQVTATNAVGTTEGPLWSFTTAPFEPPTLTDVVLELGAEAHDMAYDDARRRIYVSLPTRNEIVVVSAGSYAIVDRVNVGARPRGIDLSLDGSRLFVALGAAGAVRVLDLDTGEQEEIIVADTIGSWNTYDVAEGKSDRLFVSADGGIVRLGMIRLDQDNETVVVANERVIRDEPVFERDPDGRWLYVGEGLDSLYKLDLEQELAPIVLEDAHGSVVWTNHLAVSPGGDRIYLGSGQVLRTGSLIETATVERGVPQFGDDSESVYVARTPGTVEAWETTFFTETDTIALPCDFDEIARMTVLPGRGGWIVLGDDRLCGALVDVTCSGPPSSPTNPMPDDLATGLPLDPLLSWQDSGADCPTTYEVRFGTTGMLEPLCTALQETRCDPGPLDSQKTYDWQVVATNAVGTTEGPVWSFATAFFEAPVFTDVAFELGAVGHDMAHDIARGLIYVSLPARDEIAVVSDETYRVVDRIDIGDQPNGIDVSLDGSRLFVALGGAGAVRVLDLETGVQEEIPVGDVIRDLRTFDVIEARPNRVFVSAEYGGRIGMIRLDQGNEVVVVADNRTIDKAVFEPTPDGSLLYVGGSGRIYKLDLMQRLAPIVIDASVGNARQIELSPDGDRLHLATGRVVRTESFIPEGWVADGIPQFGTDPDLLYVARAPGAIESWNPTLLTPSSSIPLACNLTDVARMRVLPDDDGWIVLGDDLLCGLVGEAGCAGPPAMPESPFPGDLAAEVPWGTVLSWQGESIGCPTTYDVRFGTARPLPALTCHDTLATQCSTGPLAANTTYHWQIVASNSAGSIEGPVWSFTTAAGAPPTFSGVAVDLGGLAHDMAFDDARRRIYVSIPELDEIVVVSADSYDIVDRIAVGPEPMGIDLSLDGSRLFIARTGSVEVLDLDTGILEEIAVADVIRSPYTFDVIEGRPDHVFVSANYGARIGMIRLDRGNEVVVVADNRSIGGDTVFARAADSRWLYVLDNTSPNSLFQLDMQQELAPIVLEDDHGSLHDARHLAVNLADDRIHLGSGQILRTGSFAETGRIADGIQRFGTSNETVFIARTPGTVEAWDTTRLTRTDTIPVPCDLSDISQFEVLPDGGGWLVLGDDRLCAAVSDATCDGPPPPPVAPLPADGADNAPRHPVLSFEDTGSGCPTTYDVFFGTTPQPARLICDDTRERNCNPGPLASQKTYYWQVVATNGAGATTGPVWSFTTELFTSPTLTDVAVELGAIAHDMAYDDARRMIYASVPDRNEIVFVSADSYTIVDRVPVGPEPRGVDLSLDGTRLFVALGGAGAVKVIDLDTRIQEEIVVADVLGSSVTFDVIEGRPDRLFVSNNDSSSQIGMIKLDEGNQVVVVANDRYIRTEGFFERDRDGRYLYFGTGYGLERLFKLDMQEELAPVVLSDYSGTISGTVNLAVSPDGDHLHLASGQILRTASFVEAASIGAGIPGFGDDGEIVYVARTPGTVEAWETTFLTQVDTISLPCELASISRMSVLPDDGGWLVLGDDRLCGVVTDAACSGPPAPPAVPTPGDGSDGLPLDAILSWEDSGADCPTTYEVRFGTALPPTPICADASETRCDPGPLKPQTTYRWQVNATNPAGTTDGPIWSFTTAPPEPPTHVHVPLELGAVAHDMAYDDARQSVYVSLPSRNEIAVVSTDTYAVIERIVIGAEPRGIDLSLDGSRLFVALGVAGAVQVLDLDTREQRQIVVADAIRNSNTFDVIEGKPDRLFVSANGGGARIGMIKLDQNDEIVTVAGNRGIANHPVFERSPDAESLYVAEVHWLYKLDIRTDFAPILLRDSDGSTTGPNHLEVSPDGDRIYRVDGRVLRTDSFLQAGSVGGGIQQFGDDPDTVFVARAPGTLEAWETRFFTQTDGLPLPCAFAEIARLTVLPDDGGWLVLGDDLLCAVIPEPECGGPPAAPESPAPGDVATDVPLAPALTWVDPGSTCPTTYDVLFGTTSPPTEPICDDARETRCVPPALEEDTTYYWQVVSATADGATASPVWSFTTGPFATEPLAEVVVDLGAAGFDVVHDVARQVLYVTLPEAGEVVFVSTQSFEVTGRLAVGLGPRGLDLGLDGTRLFVALNGEGAVAVVDLATFAIERIPADAIGSDATWDVVEASPDRVFVSANPRYGVARLGVIKLDQGNEIEFVADYEIIRDRPTFERDPGGQFLYVGDSDHTNRVYKLDLGQDRAPIVLEDDWGSVRGTDHLAVSPDGEQIYLRSGQVLRTATFTQAGAVHPGVHRFGADDVVVTADAANRLTFTDSRTFIELDALQLPCGRAIAKELIVLPEGRGWLVLGNDRLCGLVVDQL